MTSPSQTPARRCARRRGQRGQAIIETVMGVMLLSLIFFGLVQVCYLHIAQLITHHAAFVSARSYIVGYRQGIVERAKEIGTIGLAGRLEFPEQYSGLSPAALGAIEPELIRSHVQTPDGYVIYYEHWDKTQVYTPYLELNEVVPITVRVFDYPVDMPMRQAYMKDDSVNLGSTVRMMNHAGLYLD